jgi:addiction module RelE/StbE family toxin
VWTPEAISDRLAIWDYLEERNPHAAARVDALFSESVDRLSDFPEQGRPGIVAGTRELIPHENYRLVYELESDTVWVLALVHTSRMWPPE